MPATIDYDRYIREATALRQAAIAEAGPGFLRMLARAIRRRLPAAKPLLG